MSSDSDISKLTEQGVSVQNCLDVVNEASADVGEVRKSWRFWVAFFVLILCTFLSSIDATILATALPPITKELNGTTILAFWCATSFLLAKTVVQPGFTSIGYSNPQYGATYRRSLAANIPFL
jgi:hypothetical protein